MEKKDLIIKNLQRQVKALEEKIDGSEINQKLLKSEELRSHWYGEYTKMATKYEEVNKKNSNKQQYIDNLKTQLRAILGL